MKRWWTMIVAVVAVVAVIKSAMSDPQTESLLVEGCSQYNGSNIFEFFRNFNSTLADIRRDISVNKTHWATQQQARNTNNPVYTMFQCRNYLSTEDCLACFDKAAVDIRAYCKFANGARVGYDGCFLRYESNGFYDTGTALGNTGKCNNDTVSNGTASAFSTAAQELLTDLKIATSKFSPLLFVLALLIWYQSTVNKKVAQRGHILGSTELQGPVTYNYKELKSATKNFREEYKLGEGGSGDVYKGIVKNGNIVAVKRLALSTSKAKASFESEVRLISNVHHRNLIRLLGCSSKGPDLLLVYEHMENGSLDRFLYGGKRGTLNWKQRFDIIFGTARGLAYLHEQFHVRIIHRDIKPGNILLDNDLQPKIADFGLARLLPEDQSHLNTKFAGTLGYTAPEYALQGQLSEKVDTYSFGVVVLEIVSGRRCGDTNIESETDFLLEYAWKLHEADMHMKLVDDTLDPDDYTTEDAKKIIEIALMCTQSQASLRPTMSEVVVLLLSDDRSLDQRPLNKPTFVHSVNKVRDDTSSTPPESISNATASLSEFVGR